LCAIVRGARGDGSASGRLLGECREFKDKVTRTVKQEGSASPRLGKRKDNALSNGARAKHNRVLRKGETQRRKGSQRGNQPKRTAQRWVRGKI